MIDDKLQLKRFSGITRRVEYIKVCLPNLCSLELLCLAILCCLESFHITICTLRLFIFRQRIAYLHNNFWYWVSWLAILNHIWWIVCFIACVSKMQYCILRSKLCFSGWSFGPWSNCLLAKPSLYFHTLYYLAFI
jgi:hypothetical protein